MRVVSSSASARAASSEMFSGTPQVYERGATSTVRTHAPTGTAETVVSIVNCPSTCVPTYSTALWPGATPSSGTSGTTRTPEDVTYACAGTGSAWARICTSQAKSAAVGAAPAQENRSPEISAIA